MVPTGSGTVMGGAGGAPSAMVSKGSGPGGRHRLWFPQDQGQWWEGRGPSSVTSKPGALVAYASSPGGR